jgi:DNA-binding transcriptional MerR regulator
MSEVCNITELKPYVLRFWETQFPQLRPKRRRGGNRRYTPQDIETIQRIKYLLYGKGFTIKGAKKRLKSRAEFADMRNQKIQYIADDNREILKDISGKLREIKKITEQLSKGSALDE